MFVAGLLIGAALGAFVAFLFMKTEVEKARAAMRMAIRQSAVYPRKQDHPMYGKGFKQPAGTKVMPPGYRMPTYDEMEEKETYAEPF